MTPDELRQILGDRTKIQQDPFSVARMIADICNVDGGAAAVVYALAADSATARSWVSVSDRYMWSTSSSAVVLAIGVPFIIPKAGRRLRRTSDRHPATTSLTNIVRSN